MNIQDIYGNDVINLQRPLRCQSCCFPCCLQEVEVTSPPGTPVGSIKQNWSCFPSFDIKDVTGTTVLKISGPFFTFACCPAEFKVTLVFLTNAILKENIYLDLAFDNER
jgi:hypothetical protein